MKPIIANIRSTVFTNKPVEVDYDKSLKIVTVLQEYKLHPFPVNGFSFQLGPTGMIPTTLSSYEFRTSDNTLNISLGPDRIDINSCKLYSDIRTAYTEMVDIFQKVEDAFRSCVEFKVVRLALASTWNLGGNDLESKTATLLGGQNNAQLVEWENRRVERIPLQGSGIPVNYGHKIARGTIKLPTEPILSDCIFLETDINTIPLPTETLNEDISSAFFASAVDQSVRIVSETLKKISL